MEAKEAAERADDVGGHFDATASGRCAGALPSTFSPLAAAIMALPRKAAQTTALLLARNARIRSQPIRRLHASTSRHEPEPNPVVNEDGELKVTAEPAAPLPEPKEGWFYVDSVFPIRIGQWECVVLSVRSNSSLHN